MYEYYLRGICEFFEVVCFQKDQVRNYIVSYLELFWLQEYKVRKNIVFVVLVLLYEYQVRKDIINCFDLF